MSKEYVLGAWAGKRELFCPALETRSAATYVLHASRLHVTTHYILLSRSLFTGVCTVDLYVWGDELSDHAPTMASLSISNTPPSVRKPMRHKASAIQKSLTLDGGLVNVETPISAANCEITLNCNEHQEDFENLLSSVVRTCHTVTRECIPHNSKRVSIGGRGLSGWKAHVREQRQTAMV